MIVTIEQPQVGDNTAESETMGKYRGIGVYSRLSRVKGSGREISSIEVDAELMQVLIADGTVEIKEQT